MGREWWGAGEGALQENSGEMEARGVGKSGPGYQEGQWAFPVFHFTMWKG